jgi:hypothetical protein
MSIKKTPKTGEEKSTKSIKMKTRIKAGLKICPTAGANGTG